MTFITFKLSVNSKCYYLSRLWQQASCIPLGITYKIKENSFEKLEN